MLQYDFDESIGYWVVMTARAIERALSAELAPHGITFRQGQVLGWLALEGGLSQVELADRMGIEPATLVGILDRMERAGWTRREIRADDRRKNFIVPTAKAEPVWAEVAACARRVRRRAARGLGGVDLRRLKRTLQAVRLNLEPAAVTVNGRNGKQASKV